MGSFSGLTLQIGFSLSPSMNLGILCFAEMTNETANIVTYYVRKTDRANSEQPPNLHYVYGTKIACKQKIINLNWFTKIATLIAYSYHNPMFICLDLQILILVFNVIFCFVSMM